MLGQIKSSERADNFKVEECPTVIRRGCANTEDSAE
jgi:hypothetical protein